MTELEAIDELRTRLSELEKKLDDREADLIEAKREERERILRKIEKNPIQYLKPVWDRSSNNFSGDIEIRKDNWQVLKEKE